MNSDRTAVSPPVSARLPAAPTRFRAMQHRNFQLFIAGQLISLIGTWMQNMAQLWLVYQLTHSAALLGVFGFASQVPMLFLSSLGGYVGDRYDRRRGVIVTQTISMILAFVLAGLTWANLINKWELIGIAFLVGIVNAFDVPIRQAFFVQMVGKEDGGGTGNCRVCDCTGGGGVVFLFEWIEFCGGDRGAVNDANCAERD